MPCDVHKARKKGNCKSKQCLRCILCPPEPSCEHPGSHIQSVQSGNLKRKGRGVSIGERLAPLSRATKIRGQDRMIMAEVDSHSDNSDDHWHDSSGDEGFDSGEDDDNDWYDNFYNSDDDMDTIEDDMDMNEDDMGINSLKDKLRSIFAILQLSEDKVIDQISGRGDHTLSKGRRVQQRIIHIADAINTALFDLLCVSEDANKVKENFFSRACDRAMNKIVSRHDNLVENVTTLGFHGNRSTSIIAQSVLATTFSRSECALLYRRSIDSNPERHLLPPSKKFIGSKKIASLRKVFVVLKDGKDIPKYNYTFRVTPAKLTSAVHYIESTLQVKPGTSRNIKLGGFVFRNLPIFCRGGQSVEDLFHAYKSSCDETLGLPTFRDLVKSLTKRGETKAGLSTYYIRFRYVGLVFERMLGRLAEMPYISSNTASSIKLKLRNLLSTWKDMYLFLSFKYSFKHLELSCPDKAHCSTYAMGGTCQHEHYDDVCQKCNDCFTFFGEVVMAVFRECKYAVDMDADNIIEIGSMISSLSFLQDVVKWYMGHRLRATVQISGISKIKTSLKVNPNRVLVVMDHKQKVLPMKFREGQV